MKSQYFSSRSFNLVVVIKAGQKKNYGSPGQELSEGSGRLEKAKIKMVVALKKTFRSLLDIMEVKPVNSKGNQP